MKSAQKTRNSRFLFIALALLALPELYAQTRTGEFSEVAVRMHVAKNKYLDYFYLFMGAVPDTPYAVFMIVDR